MKKRFLLFVFFAFLIFGAANQKISAQITGGYGDADINSADVKKAAQFAVSQHRRKKKDGAKLISINNAYQQIVAGLNYKLCLRVKIKGRTRNITAVVYKNLQGKYSLTSWKNESECTI